ncbi:hypothetical protein ACQP1W_34000 [Spirillospora sp. CA-255316]
MRLHGRIFALAASDLHKETVLVCPIGTSDTGKPGCWVIQCHHP